MTHPTRLVMVLLVTASLGIASLDGPLTELTAQSPSQPLIDAIKKGDAATVRALLPQRVDVNAPEADGTTALHWAAHRDDVTTAELLLRAGAKVDAANRYGVTPLSLACTNGTAALIEALLKAGANPNLAPPEGETPLMTAARTGNAAAVKLLLAHGADVKAKESWRGQDALTWAAGEGHVGAANVLIEHGADVDAASKNGYTPLMFAARQGQLEMVKTLVAAGAKINTTTKDGSGALVLAIYNSHWDLAAALLENGADANLATAGYTPLHLAIQVRDPFIEFFDPAVSTDTLDSLDVIKLLLARGADPNARMTKPFPGLEAPVDVPMPGATPFFVAAKGADTVVMRLLVASGADPLLATNGKTTPLMVAAGVGFNQGGTLRSEQEAFDAVKFALELGGNVNAANAMGFTALHGAAIRGANSIVKFLVEHGARLNAKDKAGRTALTLAEEGAGDSQQRRQLHTAALLRELMAAAR